MSPERYQRIKEVFLAVCERPLEDQDAAVGEISADDTDLAAEVRSLLESHRKAEGAPRAAVLSESEQVANPTQATGSFLRQRENAGPAAGLGPSSKSEIARIADSIASGTSPRSVARATRFSSQGRFASGTVLAERYRIVSLLGSGGMGEVYRADDLTLDQPVALKFLPQSVNSDPAWLQRFHTEVRLSRQVTHPNVCRVFDIGEVEGEQFISMEFVDGEDLACLLRRIGRLPRDKALQISRQICAGLAAAHDRGVLHRDLKPANVMLDGRGQVRITDFGISAPMEGRQDPAAGTPAYMAPEQFARGEASIRSDIYSLGLVLYEVFSGRPAFSANSMLEYARMHRQTLPTHLSTYIADMDPLAERVILRCLEKDPAKRPATALMVSGALPGGDPLAAALAAGETPSPEMVAAAGENAVMSIPYASAVLAFVLISLAFSWIISHSTYLIPRMPLDKPPAVLADDAREILASIGQGKSLLSSAQGFWVDEQYVALVRQEDRSNTRWDRLAGPRPGSVFFWYRESPEYMISRDNIGMVTLDEPARNVPGMRTIVLGPQGRLKRLEILPSVRSSTQSANEPVSKSPLPMDAPSIAALFNSADLNQADFVPIRANFTPPMFAETRLAWQGHFPENPDEIVQVQIAGLAGSPVYFSIVEGWQERADRLHITGHADLRTGNVSLQAILILVSLFSGVLLAWQNVRAGRGDSTAAHKLSAMFLLLGLLIWVLCANHAPDLFSEMQMFFRSLGFVLVPAGIVWMFYLALEPYIRRIWPETVISWTRLLAGRLGDPLVASHALIGLAVGSVATLLTQLGNLIPMALGHAASTPNLAILMRFLARDNPIAVTLWAYLEALYIALLYLLSLVLFRLILKRRWLASMAFVLMATVLAVPWGDSGWVEWVVCALIAMLILFVLVRFGLVATIAALWAIYLMRFVPITSDWRIWYSAQSRFAIFFLMLGAIAAATLATGGWTPQAERALPLRPDSRL
ncbi:MAG: serine/threonine protein kinase [Planctomycetota bacterium]|nr:serine/threonine protein kinase [Planctomycetota bacterium]